MTVQEKELLRRGLIALWELLRTEDKTDAISHIDEIVEAVGGLAQEEPASSVEASAYRSGMTTNEGPKKGGNA